MGFRRTLSVSHVRLHIGCTNYRGGQWRVPMAVCRGLHTLYYGYLRLQTVNGVDAVNCHDLNLTLRARYPAAQNLQRRDPEQRGKYHHRSSSNCGEDDLA